MTQTKIPVPITDNLELAELDKQIAALQEQRHRLLFSTYPELTIRTDADMNPKTIWPNAKHIIKYAFSVAGKHYFEFEDAFNIPCQRALSTIVFYDQVSRKMSTDFLKYAMTAADNCLKSIRDPDNGQYMLRPTDAQNIIRIVLSRLGSPMLEPDLMYQLCSAVFFDQDENPEIYEWKHNQEKMALWKSLPDANLFFSAVPIRTCLPYIDAAGDNLPDFNNLMEQRGRTELSYFQSFLSSEQSKRLSSTTT